MCYSDLKPWAAVALLNYETLIWVAYTEQRINQLWCYNSMLPNQAKCMEK